MRLCINGQGHTERSARFNRASNSLSASLPLLLKFQTSYEIPFRAPLGYGLDTKPDCSCPYQSFRIHLPAKPIRAANYAHNLRRHPKLPWT